MLLIIQRPVSAQTTVRHPPLTADTAGRVALRRPAPSRLAALRAQSELQYEEEPAPQTSAWDLFWYRFRRWLNRHLAGPAYEHGWRYLIRGIFLAAFVFVVLRLLKVDLTGAFGRAPRQVPLAYTTEGEDIHALDFPARIAEAEAAGDYRLAVRLGFLSVLKQLTDRGLLDWRPEKTNTDFLAEVPAGPLHAAFSSVVRQFEYAWYGELPLTAAHYALARDARTALLQLLTSRAA